MLVILLPKLIHKEGLLEQLLVIVRLYLKIIQFSNLNSTDSIFTFLMHALGGHIYFIFIFINTKYIYFCKKGESLFDGSEVERS